MCLQPLISQDIGLSPGRSDLAPKILSVKIKTSWHPAARRESNRVKESIPIHSAGFPQLQLDGGAAQLDRMAKRVEYTPK